MGGGARAKVQAGEAGIERERRPAAEKIAADLEEMARRREAVREDVRGAEARADELYLPDSEPRESELSRTPPGKTVLQGPGARKWIRENTGPVVRRIEKEFARGTQASCWAQSSWKEQGKRSSGERQRGLETAKDFGRKCA